MATRDSNWRSRNSSRVTFSACQNGLRPRQTACLGLGLYLGGVPSPSPAYRLASPFVGLCSAKKKWDGLNVFKTSGSYVSITWTLIGITWVIPWAHPTLFRLFSAPTVSPPYGRTMTEEKHLVRRNFRACYLLYISMSFLQRIALENLREVIKLHLYDVLFYSLGPGVRSVSTWKSNIGRLNHWMVLGYLCDHHKTPIGHGLVHTIHFLAAGRCDQST